MTRWEEERARSMPKMTFPSGLSEQELTERPSLGKYNSFLEPIGEPYRDLLARLKGANSK